ncbi:MAG TPA: APC family permease [Candidatus Eremiobacteraceae bacterium]|nr:APC family permease [Candidatus Eremiobacteraceae bacterium]
MADPQQSEPQLRRSLGLTDVAFFFVVAGSNLQWVATAAAAGPSSLPVWLIGLGAMFIPLAVSVVYLSSRYPDEGGIYVWAKRAFGPFGGFMTGWTYWCSNLPYFPALLYFTAGNALFIAGSNAGWLATSPLYFISVSIFGLALGTLVNVFGLDVGKLLNNAGGTSRWTVTLLLIALGAYVFWKAGPATPMTLATMHPGFHLKDLIFWSTIAFAWTGAEAASFMAGEIKDPRRTIPLGLIIAAPVIAAIYILGTASVLAALALNDTNALYGVMQAIEHVSNQFGWAFLTPLAAVLVTVSCFGSVGAWLGAVARLPFVAGIDRFLPTAFGRMHPRWGSPVVALLAQAAIAAVFIFLGQGGTSVKGAYDVLVSTTVVITLVPFVYIFASALKLHGGDAAQTIRIPGGYPTVKIAASIGLLTTLVSIVLAVFPADSEPNKTLAVLKVLGLTAMMIVTGIVVYRRGAHRLTRDAALRSD